jgi:hypothetical protein
MPTAHQCPREQPALQWVQDQLAGRCSAAFLRRPDAGPHGAASQDLDLVAFGAVDGFRPQRLWAPDGTPVDLAWYPAALLNQPETLAQSGLAAHRLQCSNLAWDLAGNAARQRQAFDACLHRPVIQAARVAVFMDMGYLTVREIGVSWDFPALAMFWLQMAHAACVAAMADACRIAAPNVYTRPFGHVQALQDITGFELEMPWRLALRLDDCDPLALIDPLRRLHAAVAARCSHPAWPPQMRQATRAEYDYTLPAAELDWRIAVAQDMARAGQMAAAVHYLRFWAYGLARVAMVWQRASEGHDIAFLRPERAVLPDLARHCPQILPPLTTILGPAATVFDIRSALDALLQFRRITLDLLLTRGITPHDTRDWQPHRPQSPTLA